MHFDPPESPKTPPGSQQVSRTSQAAAAAQAVFRGSRARLSYGQAKAAAARTSARTSARNSARTSAAATLIQSRLRGVSARASESLPSTRSSRHASLYESPRVNASAHDPKTLSQIGALFHGSSRGSPSAERAEQGLALLERLSECGGPMWREKGLRGRTGREARRQRVPPGAEIKASAATLLAIARLQARYRGRRARASPLSLLASTLPVGDKNSRLPSRAILIPVLVVVGVGALGALGMLTLGGFGGGAGGLLGREPLPGPSILSATAKRGCIPLAGAFFRGAAPAADAAPAPAVAAAPPSALAAFLRWAVYSLLWLVVTIYALLRVPTALGWIASECITRFAMHGYRLTIGSIHLHPWLSRGATWREGWRLHLRLVVENFGIANPEGCRFADFVSTAEVHAHAHVDFGFIYRAIVNKRIPFNVKGNPQYVGWGVVDVDTLEVRDAKLNFEMAKGGTFNVNGLTSAIADGEARTALRLRDAGTAHAKGSGAAAIARALRSPRTMPNILRVKILAARGLRERPRLKPRVEVKVRKMSVSTPYGEPVAPASDSDEAPLEYRFDSEVALPVSDASSVLHVCVWNDGGMKPVLLGQWAMTVKYLAVGPSHCKHAAIRRYRVDGTVRGAFLLSDAKLHGSAVRHAGPHEMGSGASGELDMLIQWVGVDDVPPPPPPPMSAMAQLTMNSDETNLRLGNLSELETFMSNLPILLRVDHVTLRKVDFYLKDLFLGSKGELDRKNKDEHSSTGVKLKVLEINKFQRENSDKAGVTIWAFLKKLMLKLVPLVMNDKRAILQGTMSMVSAAHAQHMDLWLHGAARLKAARPLRKQLSRKMSLKIGDEEIDLPSANESDEEDSD